MASPVKAAKLKHESLGFTEIVGRGRGWLKSRNPITGKFALSTQVGNIGWHKGTGPYSEADEIDSGWVTGDNAPYRLRMVQADYNAFAGLDDAINFDAGQIVKYVEPVSGESVAFQPQALEWTNDLDQISQVGAVQQAGGVVDDDRLTWAGAFGSGLDFEWQTQTSRLAKRLTVQSAGAIGTPPQFILDGGNPVLRLQFIFQRSAGVRAWVDGVEFSERNKEQLTTANYIEFRSTATGEVLWYFARPLVWDGLDNADSGAVMRVRATAQNLFVSVRVPWAWLQTATYPVVIDPTVDVDVAASADDGYEVNTNGVVDSTATTIYLSRTTAVYIGYCRWSVTISDGATATTAYTSLYFSNNATDDVNTDIFGEDTATPAAVTAGGPGTYDLSTRTKTTNSTLWNEDDLVGGGTGYYNSPSIVDVINELLGSYDYSSGAYIGLIYEGNTGESEHGIARTYDSGDGAPTLYIEYTEAGGGDPEPSVSDGVTVGESTTVGALVLPGVDIDDGVEIGEAVTARILIELAAVDGLTIGESVLLDPLILAGIAASDGVTAGEAVTIDPLGISLSVSDGVTVGESAAASLPAIGTIEIDVSDGATVGEAVTLDPLGISLSVSDGITAGESVDISLPAIGTIEIDVSDGATVGEAVTLDPLGIDLSVSDGITAGESVTVSLPAIGTITVSVSDGLTVGEALTLDPLGISLSVSDGITAGESVDISLPAIGTITVSVSDGLTVGEALTLDPLGIDIAASDGVTAGESVTASLAEVGVIAISVSDGISLGESVNLGALLLAGIAVSDGLTVGETVTAMPYSGGVAYVTISDTAVGAVVISDTGVGAVVISDTSVGVLVISDEG